MPESEDDIRHEFDSVVNMTPKALADPHARPFDMTGRPMKGWILVERAGIETEAELNGWVRQGVEFARGLPAKR
jgi:hypothetical protein